MMHMHNAVTACWLDCMQLILLYGTDSAGMLTSVVSAAAADHEMKSMRVSILNFVNLVLPSFRQCYIISRSLPV